MPSSAALSILPLSLHDALPIYDAEGLLEEHALVAALRLLERGHLHELVARDAQRFPAPGQRHLDAIARDEPVALLLEAERAVLEREPDDGDRKSGVQGKRGGGRSR